MRLTVRLVLLASALLTGCSTGRQAPLDLRASVAETVADYYGAAVPCVDAALAVVGPRELRALAMNFNVIEGEVLEPSWDRGEEFIDTAKACGGLPTRAEAGQLLFDASVAAGADAGCMRRALRGLGDDQLAMIAKDQNVIEPDYDGQPIQLDDDALVAEFAIKEC